jgi:hypothetical protein
MDSDKCFGWRGWEMRKIILQRRPSIPQGTFGTITIKDLVLFTIELPWKNNENNVSCIPSGTYLCKWTKSPRLKKFTYEVTGVKGRSGIRIHSANFATQVLGCIALGITNGKMEGKRGVFGSTTAVRKFHEALNQEDFQLEIRNARETISHS